MDFDEFEATYKPIKNNLNPNAPYDGMMFETYGDELTHVINHGLDHNRTIWTIVDIEPEEEYNEHGEPNPTTVIIAGYHFVNRHGFLITEKPFEEHMEVVNN